MQINASFDFAADTPQAERNNYVNAVNTVVGYFDSLFTNNVTLNIKFALGERLHSAVGTTITYERMADINTPGSLLGASNTQYDIFDYATVRNRLLTMTDTNQPAAYATLPVVSPFGNDMFIFPVAEAKALGFTSPLSLAGYDGVVGTISEEELAPGGATADWTKAAPADGDQYYMIGSIEHELTEVMAGSPAMGRPSAIRRRSTRSWTCSGMRRRGCANSTPGIQRISRSITASTFIITGTLIWRLAT